MTTPTARLSTALVGRYTIERELGAGGMATVYLAHDLKHDRGVAIKVLHPDLGAALGAERFLSEIKTTARLQHPHILPLLDSGEADGLLYYVMPVVTGETLRARLERERQLPIPEAVRIAREVANALDYAHRQGVIHRDIKPENILLHDGSALVADFGIALAVQTAGGQRMTQTGLSLGTPQYMSPEQAMGERAIDARTDIYALGAVTYEMLAGDAPFTGSSVQAIVAKVLNERPTPLHTLRDTVPAAVEEAVGTALAKLPADRFATAAEFARALAQPAAAAGDGIREARGTRARHTVRGPALASVAIAVAIAAGWWAGARRSSEGAAAEPSRLALLIPTEHAVSHSTIDRAIGLSDDGREVVYAGATSATDPTSRLYRQRIDTDSAEAIPNSEGLIQPSLSPDGAWLAAVTPTGGLVVVPARGGSADLRPVVAGPTLQGAWHPGGSFYLTRGTFREVQRFDPRTRALTAVVSVPAPGVWIDQVLPGGKRALVVVAGGSTSTGSPAVLDLATGAVTPVFNAPVAVSGLRLSAGYLLVRRGDGSLVAHPFDGAKGIATGEGVVVATSVANVGTQGQSQFDASIGGAVIYGVVPLPSLVLADREGRVTPLSAIREAWHNPRFSPDGRLLATDRTSANGRDVWVMNLAHGTLTRATVARGAHDALWSPDGRSLVYLSDESGVLGIRRSAVGASAAAESLYTGPLAGAPNGWLPDGRSLLVSATQSANNGLDVFAVRAGGAGPVEPVVATNANEGAATASPDGRWLAYQSDRTGRWEVYVRSLAPGAAEDLPVSLDGGSEPVWSRDGRELFYRGVTEAGTKLIAARVDVGANFRILSREPLFSDQRFLVSFPHSNYDVSPDGRHFAFVQAYEVERIVIVQHLGALVRDLARTKR